jgi:hypothetical protein
MNFAGTYTYLMDTPSGKRETKVVIRKTPRAYEGELISSHGGCELLENIHTKGDSIIFEAQCGPAKQEITIDKAHMTGSVIVAQDDGNDKTATLESLTYTEPKRRALILYATMTKNTERIALAMKESFEYYNWECNCIRLKKSNKWEELQDQLYFDDYDVVALGSPIVAGYPLTIINKLFSLGAGGELENNVQKMVDAGTGFRMNHDTMKGPHPEGQELPGGPGGPESTPGDAPGSGGPVWRRRSCSYPGGPVRDNYQPLGIVFTTYGGGFYGSGESKATLSALKLFLELQNVSVIGTFACCGKEFGPAGVEEGQKPGVMGPGSVPDPLYYETKEGKVQGSYFFHNQMWGHPNDRDILKAKFLVADLVEDYFLTFDGQRGFVHSEYISMS